MVMIQRIILMAIKESIDSLGNWKTDIRSLESPWIVTPGGKYHINWLLVTGEFKLPFNKVDGDKELKLCICLYDEELSIEIVDDYYNSYSDKQIIGIDCPDFFDTAQACLIEWGLYGLPSFDAM